MRVPAEAAKHPCVIMGRTMKQYALLERALELMPKTMARWIERGYAFTRALPPKAAKLKSRTPKRARA